MSFLYLCVLHLSNTKLVTYYTFNCMFVNTNDNVQYRFEDIRLSAWAKKTKQNKQRFSAQLILLLSTPLRIKHSALLHCIMLLEWVNCQMPPRLHDDQGLPVAFLLLPRAGGHILCEVLLRKGFVFGVGFFVCVFLRHLDLDGGWRNLVCLELVGLQVWKRFKGNAAWKRNVLTCTIQTKKWTWSFMF